MEPTIGQTLVQLLHHLGVLLVLVLAVAWQWILLVLWVVWWLWGANWGRLWPFLARGAWAPLVLLAVLTALVWSMFEPSSLQVLGLFALPAFWWQLGAVGLLVAAALFCGWLQVLYDWAPADLSLEPPPPSPGHGHETVHAPEHHH